MILTFFGLIKILMFNIKLKNNKSFTCDKDSTIFEAAKNKNMWVIVGARYQKDLFWEPNLKNSHIKYIPLLSRQVNDWNGAQGYVQYIALKQEIDLENTQVYACGSNDMINSAKELFFKNNLKENNFFSDAFVQTN